MTTFLKILIIALFMAAVFQIASASNSKLVIKPIKPETWMSRSYLFHNYKYCKGKFYQKGIKCKQVKK